jgi:hypothetical protein
MVRGVGVNGGAPPRSADLAPRRSVPGIGQAAEACSGHSERVPQAADSLMNFALFALDHAIETECDREAGHGDRL